MVFVHPTWFEGMIIMSSYVIIPVIIGLIILGISYIFNHYGEAKYDKDYGLSRTLVRKENKKYIKISNILFIIGVIVIIIGIFGGSLGSSYFWHEQMEVPSVQTKNITVSEIMLGVNSGTEITDASELMIVTSDGEMFENTESFWFNKFETRTILQQLKVNGTYEITYYGWREGFNDGFPNILKVNKVVDESGVSPDYNINKYFGQRMSII